MVLEIALVTYDTVELKIRNIDDFVDVIVEFMMINVLSYTCSAYFTFPISL